MMAFMTSLLAGSSLIVCNFLCNYLLFLIASNPLNAIRQAEAVRLVNFNKLLCQH